MLTLVLALALPAVGRAQTVRFGAHYGVNLTEGSHWEQERVGFQGEVRVLGPLVVSGAFSRFFHFPGMTGWTGSAWQGHANLRLRPRGKWTFWSLGYGFLVLHQRLQSPRPGMVNNVTNTGFAHTGVFGLEAPTPYIRPFADLYLTYFRVRSGQAEFNLLMGLQLPMPLP
jgi:hypothetical protein